MLDQPCELATRKRSAVARLGEDREPRPEQLLSSPVDQVHFIGLEASLRSIAEEQLIKAALNVRNWPDYRTFFDGAARHACCIVHAEPGDAALFELRMQELAKVGMTSSVIVIQRQPDVAAAVQAMEAGALTVFNIPFCPLSLCQRIREGLAKAGAIERRRARAVRAAEVLNRLTSREREVLNLVVEGRLSKQIALELGCSVRTIETHRTHIMCKTEVGSVAELTRLHLQAQDVIANGGRAYMRGGVR